MENFGFAFLLPFILSIFFLIWQEDVIFPTIGGLFLGSILISKFNPFLGFLNITGVLIRNALTDNLNIFTILIITEGLLLFSLLNRSGFINTLRKEFSNKSLTKNRLEYIISLSTFVLFIDRYFSSLLVGIFSKPFAEKKKLSPVKHAYILNTVSSSVSTIIPFTTITPFAIASIAAAFTNLGIGYSPIKAFYKSLPYQYFNIFSLFVALSTIVLNKDIFLMKKYNINDNESVSSFNQYNSISFGLSVNSKKQADFRTALYGTVGSLILIFGLIIGGFIVNQHGYNKLTILNIQNHQIIFISAIFAGIIFIILFSLTTKSQNYSQYKQKRNGISSALLIALIYIVLAMSIESLARKLGFSSSLIGFLLTGSTRNTLIPMIFFLFSSLISFLSGSFLFTITTVMPLAIRLISLNMTDPLIIDNIIFASIGSVLSGATFGDINSPFSLNFIISTASAETSVSRHFKSQIVYSLIAIIVTLIFGYLVFALGLKPYLSISSGILAISLIFLFINHDIPVLDRIKKYTKLQ